MVNNSNKKCKDSMYKYFQNLDYAISSITDDSIYFDSVSSFNDPFEGYSEVLYFDNSTQFDLIEFIILKKKVNNDVEYIKKTNVFYIYNIIIEYLNTNLMFINNNSSSFPYIESKIDLYHYIINYIQTNEEATISIDIKEVLDYFFKKWNIEEYIQNAYKAITNEKPLKINRQDNLIKVSCFAESNKSILMWAYYAGGYKGICIEYNFEDEKDKEMLFPVIYSNNRLFKSKNWFRRKAYCWKSENEWRMVKDNNKQTKIKVMNIYFGVKFDYANNDKYLEIVKLAQERNIGLYKTYLNTTTYSIETIKLFD